MQQIATSQKDIAAGVLPIELEKASGQQNGEQFTSTLQNALADAQSQSRQESSAKAYRVEKSEQAQTSREVKAAETVKPEGNQSEQKANQNSEMTGTLESFDIRSDNMPEAIESDDLFALIKSSEMLNVKPVSVQPELEGAGLSDGFDQSNNVDLSQISENKTQKDKSDESAILNIPVSIQMPQSDNPILTDNHEVGTQQTEVLTSEETVVVTFPVQPEIIGLLQKTEEGVRVENSQVIDEWAQEVVSILNDSTAVNLAKKIEGETDTKQVSPADGKSLSEQAIEDAALLSQLAIGTLKQQAQLDPQENADNANDVSESDILIHSNPTAEQVAIEEDIISTFPVVDENSIATDVVSELIASEATTQLGVPQEQPKKAPITVDPPVPVILSSSTQSTPDILEVLPETVEKLAEHISVVLPESVDKKSIKSAIVGEINTAVKELSTQKESGREPGISIKSAVFAALDTADVNLTSEQQNAVTQQVARSEQLMSIVKAVSDAANQPVQSLLNASPTSQQQTSVDQQFIASIDKLSNEAAAQVADTSKTSQLNANQTDRPIPVHQPEGQKQVAEKIRWMINSRTPAAEIRLDPPELGSMQIRVSMAGDAASVSFVVQSVQAREMLADATPRLRDMLAEQGIDLGESFVAQQDQRDNLNEENGTGQGSGFAGFSDEEGEHGQVVEQAIVRPSAYNIDAYV